MRFRLSQAAIALVVVFLFLITNPGAYQGYFSDDDLDNLVNTMLATGGTFVRGFGSLRYDPFNFRPVGHVVYHLMGQIWGLHFAPFVMLIQALHLINAFAVFWVTKSMLETRSAWIAAIFFGFHPALLAAHWKPMYIFDLLCGLALISSYYAYRRGRWFFSLLLFWCGYKAKEIAIFFPLLLLLEEWRGNRQWLRVAPFLGISLSFGTQALIVNRGQPASAYSLQFTLAAFWECLRFYGKASLGIPWLLGAAWAWLKEEERRWLLHGICAATVLLGPMLFLPGRLFSVYLYAPLMFGAIAVGAMIGRCPPAILALLLLGYSGFGLKELRAFRRAELTQAQSTKEFVEAACTALHGQHGLHLANYEGAPRGLNDWGVQAAYRLCSNDLTMELQPWDSSKLHAGDTVLRWTKLRGERGFVDISRFNGDLSGDWYAWEEWFRWMGGRATVKLQTRPTDRRIVLDLAGVQATELEARVDGASLGTGLLQRRPEQQLIFEIPPGRAGTDIMVELQARPTRRVGLDPRELGVAVKSIKAIP